MALWNEFDTQAYEGILAEVTTYPGKNGGLTHAYLARPMGAGPFPGIVLVHHLPGWDEFYRETAGRLARHGSTVIAPDLYCRVGHGAPDDIAAQVRAAGGMPDADVLADSAAAARYLRSLPTSNGKVGIFGSCSGGRHAYLTACSEPAEVDAVVDLWGGRVSMKPEELNLRTPVAPIDLTKDLRAPVLGIFGNDDQAPSPEQVDELESELKRLGKPYEFHRYDGAGHGFFYYDRPAYRQQQAMDGWNKVFAFLDRHLRR